MSAVSTLRKPSSVSTDWRRVARSLLSQIPAQRGLVIGLILILALVAFETFNFSTTQFALNDLLGDFSFAGIGWATILALAFCGIDFAGIARLLTPEQGKREPVEVWYLLAAWFLGATMNAILTWWSVSLALIQHQGLGNEILGRAALLNSVPVFIAILVWLIRVLLIGSFTLTGERLFSLGTSTASKSQARPRASSNGSEPTASPVGAVSRTSPRPHPVPRREPIYTPEPISARARTQR
jgi:hypothetical protein